MMYFVFAQFKSKYGLILYAAKCSDKDSFVVDYDNVYIHTLYFKGSSDIKTNEFYQFQTFKGENGLTYAVL